MATFSNDSAVANLALFYFGMRRCCRFKFYIRFKYNEFRSLCNNFNIADAYDYSSVTYKILFKKIYANKILEIKMTRVTCHFY